MKTVLRNLLCALSVLPFLTLPLNTYAQLNVDDTYTAEELVSTLLGEGVTVSDITIDCPGGAYGYFDCVDCNVGIPNGILLTSGSVGNAVGPNNSPSQSSSLGMPGDPDLDMIPGVLGTNDACVLEFDFTATSDTIRFNYSFGSEEYLEYVGSFNDVFAFYISGPGIAGTDNMALIPGTATTVSINNVNDAVNSEYYNINGTGFNAPFNSDDYYIQYDGFTTVLEAKHAVFPCETYHLKMAIADDLDDALDSGVFIEAGSLTSPGVTVEYNTDIEGYPYIIEGCNEGMITFSLSFAPVDTFTVTLNVDGTALMGSDYTTFNNVLEFLPGDTLIEIPIVAEEDGIDEGVETIIITLDLGCVAGVGDSLVVLVYDALPLLVSADTLICPGTEATLTASGADSYSWSPAETVTDPTEATTTVFPDENTTYTVTGTLASCVNTAETTVEIQEPTADAGADTTIYLGEFASLDADGGVEYSWSPSTGLSETDIENPTASPDFTTTYTVTVTTAIGCEFTDQVTVTVSSDAMVGVPTAFSPNSDGVNDGFTIIVRGQVATWLLQVYNRWGQLVFETDNYAAAWNGTFEGSEQPLGSYVYVLNYKDMNGESFVQQGNFTLVR
ncbi:MAG TPA: choice-of-anchor L domain-containing protein [Chitinophagales bacterium]|nr:choice-of-anchor L domain-containing protein [Chitinophagales bacterium]HMX04273.1 choice-of-anchor L domain-containing protein [Chitinophagales bacterium]HMZ89195.1 choice-of-anchor L domain-containing protein [Chitinophagales bacterium]HNA57305.1 choice-of-anchor L domain-containing protein [Chitinophagales bacterium]HNE46097.1 choice-of-anchor L domain-containing protein [Chitinophagales bacterium]